MSDLDNDGLVTQVDWKSKCEALLKENNELKENRKVFEERLEDRVRCPVCLEVPTSSLMFSCANGHLVCSSCYRGSMSDCALCRNRMNRTVSLVAATVIENIEHRCRFETDGCKVKTPLTEVEGHMSRCNFRPVECPSHLCKKKVPFEHVVGHILNECDHSFSKKGYYKNNEGDYYDVPKSSFTADFYFDVDRLASEEYPVSMFKWSDQFFFLNMKIENEHHRKFYVQMLGTDEECKKYTVKLRLKAKTGKHAIIFCDNPFPIEISEEDLKAGGMQVSNAMKEKVCFPVADRPDRLGFSLLLTFATVTCKD